MWSNIIIISDYSKEGELQNICKMHTILDWQNCDPVQRPTQGH